MPFFKKKISLIASFALALSLFAGCSPAGDDPSPVNDGTPTPTPAPAATPEPTPDAPVEDAGLSGAGDADGGIVIDFSEARMAALAAEGSSLETGESAEGGIVTGEFSHSGDASFKVTHIEGASYSSSPNGVRLDFGTPLPADTIYIISAWFYVPEEGNTEGKNGLIGAGVLINGRADINSYKYPSSVTEAGRVTYDEWMNTTYETPPYDEEIEYIVFRFYTNDAPTHPEVWYLDDISVTSVASDANTDVQDLTPIRDVYKDYFMLGTAAGAADLKGKRLDLITKHFDTVTFANEMKPDNVQNVEGEFTFDKMNGMIDEFNNQGLKIVGHTLMWHEQSPDWMWEDRDKAKERLEKHIEEVLGAAIDKAGPGFVAVDVVNEALTDGGQPGGWRDKMRNSGWYKALGPELIDIAFLKADEVRIAKGRPDLKLYYNDFNLDYEDKALSTYSMVKELREKGIPIDGIGMQAHYNQRTDPQDVLNAVKLFNTIPGIEVSVTELDITIESAQGNKELTKDEALYQADVYAELFKIYRQYAAGPANPNESQRLITRVTFWGTTDNQSWRSDRFPLLFDKNFQAKAAYYAVVDPDGYWENLPD